jgi:hypothetical protein
MLLGILCENMRSGNHFPDNAHSVLETYLNKRLTSDEDRIENRFNLKSSEVRSIAEKVAFCMTLDSKLGLSQTCGEIKEAMNRVGLRVPGNFEQFLNALAYLKLARFDGETMAGESQRFTFSHRRFQEYFATCVVLREPNRVHPKELLTDGRWRETAVVVFQTHSPEEFESILCEAKNILDLTIMNSTELIDNPVEYVTHNSFKRDNISPKNFSWNSNLIHLLGILQEGFTGRVESLPSEIRIQAGIILLSATCQGSLADQKTSLEVSGILPQSVLSWLLRRSFSGRSQWLKEVAYQQAAKLEKIPDDVALGIRKAILNLFFSGDLSRNYFATYAHLSRLDQSRQYIDILNLLRWIKLIRICLYFLSLLLFICYGPQSYLTAIAQITILIPMLWLMSTVLSRTLSGFFKILSHEPLFIYTIVLYSLKKELYSMIHPVAAFIIFLMLWPLLAILAAISGEFTHYYWWILLWVFPLLYFGRNYRKVWELLTSAKAAFTRIPKIIILLFSTMLIFLYILIFFLLPALMTNKIGTYIGFIVSSIALVFMIHRTHYFQDSFKWWKWRRRHRTSITMQKLLDQIAHYHNSKLCTLTVSHCREKDLLAISAESENLLSELAINLERKECLPSSGLHSDHFKIWLNSYTEKRFQKLSKDNEFIDEIYILLEKIHLKVVSLSVDDKI